MPCIPFTFKGGRGILCTRTPRPRCACGRPSEFQCDAPTQRKSGTCDKHLCSKCATAVGPDKHLCPVHKAEMIDRVVLHGTPGDEPGSQRMHPVQPYDGEPRPTVALSMRRLDGVLVRDVGVVFFYSRTDEHGLPHYRLRAA